MRVAAILLAAGSSSRFGRDNKLFADVAGEPLVRCVAKHILASRVDHLIVVSGPDKEALESSLAGLAVEFAHNSQHTLGMGSSISVGILALRGNADGAFIVPGDLPNLQPSIFNKLIAEFRRKSGTQIIVPVTSDGAQRNPVLWPRKFFDSLAALSGNRGGKHLLEEHPAAVSPVSVGSDEVFLDIDTRDDLALANRRDRPQQ